MSESFTLAVPFPATRLIVVLITEPIPPEARRAFWLGMAFERTSGAVVEDARAFLELELTHQGATHRVTYATPWDVPVEDVPCSCGADGAYFLKWEP